MLPYLLILGKACEGSPSDIIVFYENVRDRAVHDGLERLLGRIRAKLARVCPT